MAIRVGLPGSRLPIIHSCLTSEGMTHLGSCGRSRATRRLTAGWWRPPTRLTKWVLLLILASITASCLAPLKPFRRLEDQMMARELRDDLAQQLQDPDFSVLHIGRVICRVTMSASGKSSMNTREETCTSADVVPGGGAANDESSSGCGCSQREEPGRGSRGLAWLALLLLRPRGRRARPASKAPATPSPESRSPS